MDDLLIAAQTQQELQEARDSVIAEVQNAGLEISTSKIQEIAPWKYLGWKITEQTIRPQKIQVRTKISNLQDLQQLLGEINWMKPILGITNDELASLFNLLRGDCNIKSPRTLTPEAQEALERIAEVLQQRQAHRFVAGSDEIEKKSVKAIKKDFRALGQVVDKTEVFYRTSWREGPLGFASWRDPIQGFSPIFVPKPGQQEREKRWKVALYIKKVFDAIGIETNEDGIECLWVRIKGKANKADILLEVCFRPPNQEEEVDNLFYKQLENVSGSSALVLVGDFNLPDICWELNTAEKRQSRKLLECMEDNFCHSWWVTCLVDAGSAVDVVYWDFSKAFVTVSHSILLEKLAARGLDRSTLLG
ncbi:hypothetical protein DUI87_01012 [Hirundo rustica rustica]|uniref:ribonuclease H n=1 Tax=Hirundo rustica rustica TaxID=333673 RepID=A0A3M0L527_HIRRU|nr:hypothetical protein DUI87_01012 [Hirundo rustica rustica]